MGKNSEQMNVKFTVEQRVIIKALVGPMGGTEAEVVRNIVIAWLSEKSVMTELIKKMWLDKKG